MTRKLRSALAARNQLRMRELAGVVAVTLAALAAFDLTAVATMRNYLHGQAQSQLSAEVPDWGELQVMLRSGYTLPGQYSIIWLPTRGTPRAIQIPLSDLTDLKGGAVPIVTHAVATAATKPGFHTVSVAGQMTMVERTSDPGGFIVTGTSLAPVTNTLAQIERIVVIGSALMVLLIGAGVLLV